VDLDAEHRPLVSQARPKPYKFFVQLRHPDYRPVISTDAPFPSGASEADWRDARSREASDVKCGSAIARGGCSLFRTGLSLS